MVDQWWDYPSNFSNGLEVNGTGTFMQYLNGVTGNHLGMMLLFLVGIISFLSLKAQYSSIKSLNAMIIIVFFMSIPAAMMGILDWTMAAVLGLVTILITLMMRSDANQGL